MTLSLTEARKNNEVISMGSSQVLRWIDELNGITDADAKAVEIRNEIAKKKREQPSIQNRRAIRKLYESLDSVQFKPDYMSLVIDRDKDYYRAMKGFSINGISYKRLVSTVGGMKTGTIVFVSERLHDELARRIDNGRDMSKEFVPAKLEAYRALACSASVPVSLPNGILVVHDAETKFKADTIYLSDENPGEPEMEIRNDVEINMDCTDGFGIMLPSLAERWSEELGLDYVVSGVNTRFSYEKGMVFTFDFIEFAEKVAYDYIVKDVWGNDVDIRNVELIFTDSMLKLWDSYSSIDDYINNCLDNGYTMGVTKTCPKELENERNLNYQFIQSYKLNDDDIDELIEPTMKEIYDVLEGDWRKTLLFLCGSGLNDEKAKRLEPGIIKAIMADDRMINDPYVKSAVYRLIKNRINEAKVGVVKVHGNYSIVSGDPYILCQSIFGMELTGILKAGQIYNKYWEGVESLACFRAPMSCHNNIRLVHPQRNDMTDEWYKYMNACTIFNAWDTATSALNGCDYDGDLVMLTDNRVLVEKLVVSPAVMCVQRKAKKKVVTEEDIVTSNIDGFGNDIGKVTNRVTSMFELQSHFDEHDEEYKILEYRIKCGQLIQQNVIDKSKGIVAKPMPKEWFDRHALNTMAVDPDTRNLYRSIVADRKPYFMRYIYPDLMKQYNTYIKNTDRSAMREFQMSVEEMMELPYESLTERQKDFIRYYHFRMPVGTGDCVMNKICRRFEDEFDGFFSKKEHSAEFDFGIMRSGVDYTQSQVNNIKCLYDDYNSRLRNYTVYAKYERIDEDDAAATFNSMREEFIRSCDAVCQNRKVLCEVLIDICYRRSATKKFVWDMCGDVIVENLMNNNGMSIRFPELSDDGDIYYGGNKFELKTVTIGEIE